MTSIPAVLMTGPPDPDAPIELPDELQSTLTSGGILTTYWPTAIIAVIAAGLVWMWWRHRTEGNRPVLRGTLYLGAASIAMVLALALGVNTWVGYVPTWTAVGRIWDRLSGTAQEAPAELDPAAAGAPTVWAGDREQSRITTGVEGGLSEVRIPATAHGVAESPAWVYLPPDYDKPGNTSRYPVYYVVHGGPGTGADWFNGGNLEAAANLLIDEGYLPPCIIVSPDLNGGGAVIDREPLNLPNGPQLEDYLVKDVVGWVDANLRSKADREHRVLGGMSAGAFASLNVGMHAASTFGGIISLMPYVDPYTPEIVDDSAAAIHYDPITSIIEASIEGPLPTYLAQGEDARGDDIRAIKRSLDERQIVNTMQLFADLPHNWTMARDSMPYAMIWTARQLEWN